MMGREALVRAQVGDEVGDVRALLERTEMILRGEIRRRYLKVAIEQMVVDGDVLSFRSAGEHVRLHLGAKMAQSWAIAITRPPPSLRVKLGLDKGARAALVGKIEDDALAEATEGSLVPSGMDAQMLIALVDDLASLTAALEIHASLPTVPLWAIYPKGRGVAFGDAAIRAVLREAGFQDTKSCSISNRLTATRYNPK